MAKDWYHIHGVTVETRATAEGAFDVFHGTDVIGQIRYSRADGHARWYCACSVYQSAKCPAVLAHLLDEHTSLSQRPLLTTVGAGKGGKASLVAMTTYLRLTGRHADPTADQALQHVSGRSW